MEEASHIREELNQLLLRACMTLRKWRSNSQELIHSIPEELREKETVQTISVPGDCQKALGVHWNTDLDNLYVATPPLTHITGPTKRLIASGVAKTFDLMGWFSPSVIVLKVLLQKLNDWDDPVPATALRNWQDKLTYITNHPVPRYYFKAQESRGSRRNYMASRTPQTSPTVEWCICAPSTITLQQWRI